VNHLIRGDSGLYAQLNHFGDRAPQRFFLGSGERFDRTMA
jgi:hypothetical protein